MAISKAQALRKRELPKRQVFLPQWADENQDPAEVYVYVRTLTAGERDYWETTLAENAGEDSRLNMKDIRAKLAALAAVDDDENRIFSDDDIEALSQQSCVPVHLIFDAAMDLNGMSQKHVDKLAKNSKPAPTAAST